MAKNDYDYSSRLLNDSFNNFCPFGVPTKIIFPEDIDDRYLQDISVLKEHLTDVIDSYIVSHVSLEDIEEARE